MRRKRSEIKAGILIVICFIAFWVILLGISDISSMFLPKQRYILSYNQVGGLAENSIVRYAGYEVGRVIDVSCAEPPSFKDGSPVKRRRLPELPPEKARVENIFVTIEVAHEIILTELDKAYISSSFTGSVQVDILPGHPTPGEKEPAIVTEDNILHGQPYITMGQIVDKASGIIDDVREIMPALKDAAGNFNATMKQAKSVVQRIDAVLEENRPRIDQTFTDIAEASKNVKGMTAEMQPKLPEIMANVKQAAGDAAETLAKIKPKAIASADNIEKATENVKETTAKTLLLVTQNRERIDKLLENFRDASARLNLGMEDIRRNPWKLLTRNINADPRTQNVYDAALAFSDAARALSQATSDLKTLTATGAAEPATVQEATNELNKLVENLRLIERELYRLFKTHPAP